MVAEQDQSPQLRRLINSLTMAYKVYTLEMRAIEEQHKELGKRECPSAIRFFSPELLAPWRPNMEAAEARDMFKLLEAHIILSAAIWLYSSLESYLYNVCDAIYLGNYSCSLLDAQDEGSSDDFKDRSWFNYEAAQAVSGVDVKTCDSYAVIDKLRIMFEASTKPAVVMPDNWAERGLAAMSRQEILDSFHKVVRFACDFEADAALNNPKWRF
jgi:hypothetical protein